MKKRMYKIMALAMTAAMVVPMFLMANAESCGNISDDLM